MKQLGAHMWVLQRTVVHNFSPYVFQVLGDFVAFYELDSLRLHRHGVRMCSCMLLHVNVLHRLTGSQTHSRPPPFYFIYLHFEDFPSGLVDFRRGSEWV